MATLPAFLKKNEAPAGAPHGTDAATRTNRMRPVRHPFQLRALPHEHLFLYNKRIDNSRLVREADPKSRGACWSAIGAASVIAVLLTSAFAPSVATTIAGYKLEALRVEERRLLEEHRGLDLQEAELLSQARLDQLARQNNLVTPSSSQVVHLEGKPQGAVAMAK
jgi:cell division protein FtsL